MKRVQNRFVSITTTWRPNPEIRAPRSNISLSEERELSRVASTLRRMREDINLSDAFRSVKLSLGTHRRYRREPLLKEYKLTALVLGETREYTASIYYHGVKALSVVRDLYRADVRHARQERRAVRVRTVMKAGKYMHLVGGVHQHTGDYLNVNSRWKRNRVREEKRPVSEVKHIGVEIEFYSTVDEDTLVDSLVEAKLERYVQLKGDGSIHPTDDGNGDGDCDCSYCGECGDCGDNGDECQTEHSDDCSYNSHGYNTFEITVLASEAEYADVVRRVCAVLNGFEAKVNATCGLHVHLDMRKRDVKRAYGNLVHALPVLSAMQPIQRRQNSFCEVNRHTDIDAQLQHGNRYLAVNPHAHRQHTTLEVRLHTGTTNALKIIHWVGLLVRIANAQPFITNANTPTELFARILSTKAIRAHVRRRIAKFSRVSARDRHSDLNEAAA